MVTCSDIDIIGVSPEKRQICYASANNSVPVSRFNKMFFLILTSFMKYIQYTLYSCRFAKYYKTADTYHPKKTPVLFYSPAATQKAHKEKSRAYANDNIHPIEDDGVVYQHIFEGTRTHGRPDPHR